MNQLKQIASLGGRVYIRSKGHLMTMTLRYQSTVFTVSELPSNTANRNKVIGIFLEFINKDQDEKVY
jgi:hypothetical protein